LTVSIGEGKIGFIVPIGGGDNISRFDSPTVVFALVTSRSGIGIVGILVRLVASLECAIRAVESIEQVVKRSSFEKITDLVQGDLLRATSKCHSVLKIQIRLAIILETRVFGLHNTTINRDHFGFGADVGFRVVLEEQVEVGLDKRLWGVFDDCVRVAFRCKIDGIEDAVERAETGRGDDFVAIIQVREDIFEEPGAGIETCWSNLGSLAFRTRKTEVIDTTAMVLVGAFIRRRRRASVDGIKVDGRSDEVDMWLDVSRDRVRVAGNVRGTRLMFVDMILGFKELLRLGDGDVHFNPVTAGMKSDTLPIKASIDEPRVDGLLGVLGGTEKVGYLLGRPVLAIAGRAGVSDGHQLVVHSIHVGLLEANTDGKHLTARRFVGDGPC